MATSSNLLVRQLGVKEYIPIWQAMQAFTQQRDANATDELWLLQHPPIYTLGLNGKRKHLLLENDIPVIDVDRGGQITYHGPGQLVAYTMIDLQRKHLGVRDLVQHIEQAVINLLQDFSITSARKQDAPGVYVQAKKIAALGLRIKKNRSYHGLSLNIHMDLSPFSAINPCGYEGMSVTQLSDLTQQATEIDTIAASLVKHLSRQLQYNDIDYSDSLPERLRG